MKYTVGCISIIELGNSHDECIYSQIAFLKNAGYNVHLILSEGLKAQADNFPGADAVCYFPLHQRGIKGWRTLIKIKRYLQKANVTQVIFNTASGNAIRNFILLNLFSTSVLYAGTIHHTSKLSNSFTQRIISLKVKRYSVLNDYLLNSIIYKKGIFITSYYPIFFPNYKPVELIKAPAEFWICVPGQLEFKRRDYLSLLTQLDKDFLPAGLKFIFLGRCSHEYGNGDEIRMIIKQKNLESHFILFDHFIENAMFHAYLKLADVILPLIHEGCEGFKSYASAQISGAFNLAFAYRKPLLMHHYFKDIADFNVCAFFYDTPDLIKQCIQLYNSPGLCSEKAAAMASYYKFNFDFQQQQYLQLLKLP